ncbi:LysM peptidoglycan-binding domain-containing protein [Thalassobacillus pellis]|uniref:LysM peptidoglycan-binding domain-containing protein n=1 Tax=Thalassobacillus pellis TaxID=748008 RepID=UPI001961873F|nr:LysM peptidoglycan-binding domain-containing protein [Thalassobacillus pellis]MBM7553625.1 LysM repeat protein [Thalassobacillus pellis]
MPIAFQKSYIYTVQDGDTLYAIANRFGSSVSALETANHLFPPVTDAGLIYPEDVLVIPTMQPVELMSYMIQPGDTLFDVSESFSAHPDLVAGINRIADPSLIYPGQPLYVPAFGYNIGSGDTLFGISRTLGVPIRAILEANADRTGFQPDIIWQGYQLIIPLPTSRNIIVVNPYPGMKFQNGQLLEGFARVFEAVVNYQVRDANGAVITDERFTMTNAGAPAYGWFSVPVLFDRQPATQTGELWVYSRSAKDGSMQDLLKITIKF